jgi:cytoskeletal protein RodZ
MFEIGSSLREARMRQSLEFDEMESRTKIRSKYLRALEDEQFEVLPANTYVKGFLRAYADSLGLDGQLYVDEYNSRFVVGDEDAPIGARRVRPSAAGRRRRPEHRESHVVAIAIGAIAILTALVIAAWRFGGPDEPSVRGLATASKKQAPAASAAARSATVEVRAVRGDSFMEVRAGSRAGRQIYRGTLERGQVQRFPKQHAVYVSLGSPENILVKLNGNRIRFPHSGEAVVTPIGLRIPR